jgi:hypothetical protein
MHYLQDGPFEGPKKLGAVNSPQNIGVMFANLAGEYQPIPTLSLKTAEIRKLNKALDVLEAGPEGGYFALEDEDFKVLEQVLISFAENSNMARSAPYIEDILNGAAIEKPGSEDLEPEVPEDAENGTVAKPKKRSKVAKGA